MDHSGDNVERMEPNCAQRWSHGHIRRGPVTVAMKGKGRNRLIGGGRRLIGKTGHVVDIIEHINHRFDLEAFVEAACWLDDQFGHNNWCYDGMSYHFDSFEHMVQFKLRYLYE